jgi:hypothetical protein
LKSACRKMASAGGWGSWQTPQSRHRGRKAAESLTRRANIDLVGCPASAVARKPADLPGSPAFDKRQIQNGNSKTANPKHLPVKSPRPQRLIASLHS